MPKKKTLQEVIGEFIKRERKKQNFSLEKLALLSMGSSDSQSKISLIERGLVKEYSVETLNKILHALGYEFADMFKE